MPKALPEPSRDADTHDRVRHDIIGNTGTVTLRVAGQLRHIGIGRTHVLLLIQDLHVSHHRRTPPRPQHRPHTGLPTPEMKQGPNPQTWVRALQMS
nr:hypothetical protein [Tersicoccus solisilvae]